MYVEISNLYISYKCNAATFIFVLLSKNWIRWQVCSIVYEHNNPVLFLQFNSFYLLLKIFKQPDTFRNLNCIVQLYKITGQSNTIGCFNDTLRARKGWRKSNCYICNIYSLLFRSNTPMLYNSNTYDKKKQLNIQAESHILQSNIYNK